MKIVKLQSENFKKIKAISIEPKDNTVIISGKNGQGKTSVLDSILMALAGKQKDIIKPIRDGELKSTITLDLGKFIVIRTFKENSTKLEIVNKDGEFIPSPQTMLDELIGQLAFDPLEFANKSQKEQRATLLKLVEIDYDTFLTKRKHFYDLRHEVGLEKKALPEYTFQEIAEAEKNSQLPVTDIVALNNQILQIADQQRQYANACQQHLKLNESIDSMKGRIEELKQQIQALEDGILQAEKEKEELSKVQPAHENIDLLKSALANADQINNAIHQADRVLGTIKQIKALEEEYNKFDTEISKLDRDMELTLEKTSMPIEGLGVNEDCVTFNKIPFAQLSTSEKLKVSMAIAMAMNPELRVIRILDGSLLDEDNMAIIKQMANDQDFQIWVEVVDSSGKVGIYIEDGEVVPWEEKEAIATLNPSPLM